MHWSEQPKVHGSRGLNAAFGFVMLMMCSGCVMYVPDQYPSYDLPPKPSAWAQPYSPPQSSPSYAPPQRQEVAPPLPPPMAPADPIDADVLERCRRHEAPQDVEACIALNREMQRQGGGAGPAGRVDPPPQVEVEELPPSVGVPD